jgi:hypothetical protein
LPSAGSASLIDMHVLTHLLPSEDFRLHELLSVQMLGDLVSSIIPFSPEQVASRIQFDPFKMSG